MLDAIPEQETPAVRNLSSAVPPPPAAQAASEPRYRDAGLSRPEIAHEWRADGALLMRTVDAPVTVTGPLIVLSGNSLEQVVLTAAAEYIGILVAPVSPAYSLQSQEFTRLLGIRELVDPAAVFVQSAAPFAKALQAIGLPDTATIVVNGAERGQLDWRTLADGAMSPQRLAASYWN